MKILWIVNVIFPYPSKMLGLKPSNFGGWLNGLYEELVTKKELKLAIATVYKGKELKRFYDGKTYYYLIPYKNTRKYDIKSSVYWQKINEEFQPEIIHLHGSEYPFGLVCLNTIKNPKKILSIQGLVSVCYKDYLAGLSTKDIISNITIRDILKNDNLYKGKRVFYKLGKYEKEMIKKVGNVIGRTNWDYANAFNIAGKDKYLKCNESLRSSFYNKNWDSKVVEKHTIFISQASYPIKGFHQVIKAANILKNKYADLKIYVAGSNILKADTLKEKLKLTGYAKYLKKLIKKYNLENVIHFTGVLNESEMADRMLKSNVFVQASSIENSSNSLGEAMLLGMPIVASYVGGTGDMLKDKEEGLLYPFIDYTMLAHYVSYFFDNLEDAELMGKKAQEHAKITHDRKRNAERMLEIYKELLKKDD